MLREQRQHTADGGTCMLDERQVYCQDASGLIEEVELEEQSQA